MDLFVRFLNPLLMIALPLALGVFLARRWALDWRLFGAGALTFVASQALHLPFNSWALAPLLGRLGLGDPQGGAGLLLVLASYGLSAGLFEETARYLAYRRWLKEARDWRQALMFGAGHGGIEAILLGLLVLYGLIQAAALRDADLSQLVPPGQLPLAQDQLAAYWALPWHQVLLGAVERLGALGLHLSLALVVLRAVTHRQPAWLAAAVAWHALVNTLAVFTAQSWGVYLAEALIVLLALASLGLAWILRPPDPEPAPRPPGHPTAVRLEPTPPTAEQLEASRYE